MLDNVKLKLPSGNNQTNLQVLWAEQIYQFLQPAVLVGKG